MVPRSRSRPTPAITASWSGRCTTPTDAPRYLRLSAGPLARTGHRIFGAVGALQDITQIRTQAQARRRELAEAKQQVWRLEGVRADLALHLEMLEMHASRAQKGPNAGREGDEPAPLSLDASDFSSLPEALPDQVWVLDGELRCRYVNAAGAVAARRRASRLIGSTWMEVPLASDLVVVLARNARGVLEDGGARDGVWTDGVEGALRICRYAVRRIADRAGGPGVLVVLTDGAPLHRFLRDRARPGTRQERLNADLQAILDQMPVGVVVAEVPSGRVIYRNPGFAGIWDEATPSPARVEDYGVWTGRRPGDGPFLPEDWPLARAVRDGREVRDEEVEVIRKDGSPAVYSVNAVPVLDESGEPYAAAAAFIDVTARRTAEEAVRASEARLRLATASVPMVFAIVDRDGRYLFVNEAGAAFAGRPAGELIGRADDEIPGPGGRPPWHRLLDETIRTLDPIGGEVRWTGPDGGERILLVTCLPLPRDDGGCDEVLLVAHDITEERQAARELARSNEDLQRFAHVASHDLQEPLRSIVSFVQLLERRYRGRLDEDADEMIGFIVEGGTRMQGLIDGLRAFSRIATRARPFAALSLDGVVRDAQADLRCAIAENGAEIRHGRLPTVLGDRDQVVQVFENLIANALKFRRPDARPEVRISAFRDGEMWHLMVADNGIGIEPEYFERIFVIFQRLHTRDAYPGTGVGLAIVKRIVERHGGRCWVESVPGEGSIFHFTLPMAPVESRGREGGREGGRGGRPGRPRCLLARPVVSSDRDGDALLELIRPDRRDCHQGQVDEPDHEEGLVVGEVTSRDLLAGPRQLDHGDHVRERRVLDQVDELVHQPRDRPAERLGKDHVPDHLPLTHTEGEAGRELPLADRLDRAADVLGVVGGVAEDEPEHRGDERRERDADGRQPEVEDEEEEEERAPLEEGHVGPGEVLDRPVPVYPPDRDTGPDQHAERGGGRDQLQSDRQAVPESGEEDRRDEGELVHPTLTAPRTGRRTAGYARRPGCP